jgi:hypothetical protein
MSYDPAVFKALAEQRRDLIGPCNKRCERRGSCAFGRADAPGRWCRERRPPNRAETLALRTRPGR